MLSALDKNVIVNMMRGNAQNLRTVTASKTERAVALRALGHWGSCALEFAYVFTDLVAD